MQPPWCSLTDDYKIPKVLHDFSRVKNLLFLDPIPYSLFARTKQCQAISATVATTKIESTQKKTFESAASAAFGFFYNTDEIFSTKFRESSDGTRIFSEFSLPVISCYCFVFKVPGVFQKYREIMFF